uniref:RING-type domain-containing protein n=2 Tax=Meloidogyne TaxID=189290 RepID=A0A6V7WPT5_MELEN|nr:unnamed protein product [Meloidogyne enterolobii]
MSSSSSSSSSLTTSSSSSSSSLNPPNATTNMPVFGPKTAAEARRIEEQRRASEQERALRRNENLRRIINERQQRLEERRRILFTVHIPDFNSVDSGDEEEFYSDEDVDDESLIRIPRAATANGRAQQIQRLENRRGRRITTDEPLQWFEPERKIPEQRDTCLACWKEGCASTICYGICGHLSMCEACANKSCRTSFGENFYPNCPLCRLQTPYFKSLNGRICRGNE